MTLAEIKTAVEGYFPGQTISDELFLTAANHVRRDAEMNYDYEFLRRLVTVSVNGVTGGDLTTAVQYGTETSITIKSVIEAGLFDDEDNLRPVEWTTVAESLERQRGARSLVVPRIPRDSDLSRGPSTFSGGLFEFSGDLVYLWPKSTENNPILGLEVYSRSSDWTTSDLGEGLQVTGTLTPDVTGDYFLAGLVNGQNFYVRRTSATGLGAIIYHDDIWYISNLSGGIWQNLADVLIDDYASVGGLGGTATVGSRAATSDVWTTEGAQFLQWSIIVQLNYKFKTFVPRQEGNLPPPKDMVDEGLVALREWDTARYETFRRHGR